MGEVDGGAVRDALHDTTRYWGGRDGCGKEWRVVAAGGWRSGRGRYERMTRYTWPLRADGDDVQTDRVEERNRLKRQPAR
jgi:hypothetical protein